MRVGTALKQGLARVGRAWRDRHYLEALAEVDGLLEISPANPSLLILRAQLIQLQDDEVGAPTLDDARMDLKLAADLDEQSPVALVELGYLLYAMADDAKAASRYFQKAIPLCKDLLKEALIGQAKAFSELERDADALACLAEAYSLLSHNGKSSSEDLLEQWKSLQRAN